MILTFFRIVLTDPPTEADFYSHQRPGIPLRHPFSEMSSMHTGVSVFATITQAQNKARKYPHLGGFIAIMEIDDGGTVAVARTSKDRGHNTSWADPGVLLRSVVPTDPVHD